MKLKFKLALFNIVTKLLLVVVLWFALPFLVKNVIFNYVDKNLIEKKLKFINNINRKEIQDFLLTGDSTEVFDSFSTLHDEFIQLEISGNQHKIKLNTFVNDLRKIENQEAEFRILKHNFRFNNINYQLEIGSNINEINDLITLIHYFIVVIFLIVAVISFIIDLFYINFLMLPLFMIVETKIKLINNPEKFGNKAIQTSSTEFKYLDQALNEMMVRINTIFKKEKEFIGNVSHELLTPIAILKNRFENLIQNPSLNNIAVDKIAESLSTLDNIKKIINNLLLISRIDNKQYLTNEPINFDEIFVKILENLDDRILEKNIFVNKKINQQFVFHGNKVLIQILLTNLLANAIKYNLHSGTILISDEVDVRKYVIVLADTGIGMHQEQVWQIFNRFTQINSEQDGQGIGLAIADSIANLHHIQIKVSSVTNQGTIFKLIFPIIES